MDLKLKVMYLERKWDCTVFFQHEDIIGNSVKGYYDQR